MRIAIAFLISALPLTGCTAQEHETPASDAAHEHSEMEATPEMEAGLDTPSDWHVRLDRPDDAVRIGSDEDADIFFVTMEPGWHITTHKAAIYYNESNSGEGSFSAKTTLFLFDPGQRDREAFGIFVGGKNLDGDSQEYTYFLLRNEGEFLVKRRTGSETSVLVDWTATDAMNVHPGEGTESVENSLEVRAAADAVAFLVNGQEVASVPREAAVADGIVGLRVNHGLNLHVSEVTVGEL